MAENKIGPRVEHYTLASLDSITLDKPGRVVNVYPGEEVAWDNCCDGQLWTRVVQILPPSTETSPTLAKGTPCGIPWWDVYLATGILRCAPAPVGKKMPAPSSLNAAGWGMTQDAVDIMEAIVCDELTYRMVGWLPLGSEGGCVGGEWTYITRVQNCACP